LECARDAEIEDALAIEERQSKYCRV